MQAAAGGACPSSLPSPPSRSTAPRIGAEAAARLLRAEAVAGQQGQRVDELARQLDKLSTRARLTGRDIKLPIQQVRPWPACPGRTQAGAALQRDARLRGRLPPRHTALAR